MTYPDSPVCDFDYSHPFYLMLNLVCDDVEFHATPVYRDLCSPIIHIKTKHACGTSLATGEVLVDEQEIKNDFNAFWTWLNNNKVVMCIVFMLVGIIVGLLGRKLFSVIVFLAAVFVSIGLVMVISYATFLKDNHETWVGWVTLSVGAILGLLLGWLFVKIIKLGAFAVAAFGGFQLGLFLYETFPMYKIDSQAFFWCFCIGLALICGLLAVCLFDHVLILTTAFGGAYLFVSGIGLVAGHFDNPFTIASERAADPNFTISGWFYLYMAGILVMAIFCSIVQYRHRKTQIEEDHDPYNRLK